MLDHHLFRRLGRAELSARPTFPTNALRVQNRAQIDAQLEPIFDALPVAEVIARLETAGISWGCYSEMGDLSRHPALRRVEIMTDVGDLVNLPRPAGHDASFRPGPAPQLGVDTDNIRREFASQTDASK